MVSNKLSTPIYHRRINTLDKIKAVGLLKLQLNGIMAAFRMYGLQDHIPAAIEQIVNSAEEFHNNLNAIKKEDK